MRDIIGTKNVIGHQLNYYKRKIEECKEEAKRIASQIDEPYQRFPIHIKTICVRLTAVAKVIRGYEVEITRLCEELEKL